MTLLLSTLLIASGCRHNINTSNPAVVTAATLLDASNTCVAVEDGLTAANHAVDALETQEPEYYAHVKPLLKKLSTANVAAVKLVQAAKNGQPANWQQGMLAMASAVTPADLSAVQVKNPTSQAIAQGALATLIVTLNTIPHTFGGSK